MLNSLTFGSSPIEQRIGFIACLGQAPILIMTLLWAPEPTAILFSARMERMVPDIDNNSSSSDTTTPPTDPKVSLSVDEYGLSPLFLVASMSAVLFAAITHQLHEQQLLDNALEYTEDHASEAGLWTASLWAMGLLMRLAIALRITEPVDYCQLALAVLITVTCLATLCHPGVRPYAGILLFGFACGLLLTWDAIEQRHGMRVTVFALLACADMLVLLGHVYDQRPTMLAVGNCRLVYAGTLSLVLWFAYRI